MISTSQALISLAPLVSHRTSVILCDSRSKPFSTGVFRVVDRRGSFPFNGKVPHRRLPDVAVFSEGRLVSDLPENFPSQKTRLQVLKDVAAIAAPVLGACLVEPALTMIDTWFIGRLRPPPARAAVIGLAALSANCSLFNLLTTALSFFCTATAGMVARGAAAGDPSAARRALTNGAYLSVIAGATLSAVLLLFARPILTVRKCYGKERRDRRKCARRNVRQLARRPGRRRNTQTAGPGR